MARQPRYRIADVAQLITQRGNNQQNVFFTEQDYLYYLQALNDAAIKYKCNIHAFVLLSNKIHILATPTKLDGISQLMKSVGQRYVSYINKLEKRSGTLWDGRYKASLVEDGDYILDCMHYIDTIPVQLNIVTSPIKYKWSSYYSLNAQGSNGVVLITPHNSYSEIISWSDKSDKDIQEAYKQIIREQLDKKKLKTIQKATNSCIILGSDEFQRKYKKIGSDPKEIKKP